MEVNDPSANPEDPWFVTSGLLTRELISGRIQIGDNRFLDAGEGAAVHVAGDPMSPFPHYRHLVDVIDQGSPDRAGERADQVLTPEGMIDGADHPDDPNAEFVHHIVYDGPWGTEIGYNIPAAFWDYLNAPGTVYDSTGSVTTADPLFSWVFVMGYPISDPFWAEVPVSGVTQWVLIQPFERRVLTYTPSNDPEWQVEMGNIGQHYRDWRSQYFAEARTGGNPEFFGLHDQAVWHYGTNRGQDEIWQSIGTSDSFSPGSTLYARDEYKLDSLRTTYWSPGDDGLYLHGWERRDENRVISDLVVYSPPLHVLPAEWEEITIRNNTLAISMQSAPERASVNFEVVANPLVNTPAGFFQTWRVESRGFDNPAVDHRLGHTFWFEPGVGMIQWIGNEYIAYLVDSSVLED
jgi:hypothetical protein